MDWGWVAQRTVELTIANLDRLRASAASFLSGHPVLSGLAVLVLVTGVSVLLLKRGRASSRDRRR
jgi:hypothetical protein